LEEVKDKLDDAASLDFLHLDLSKLLRHNSHGGLSGLSNLGNT